tara:strand:+ start:642 stop:1781 length:1140 start_codon:yes stop_codon:yes gene_type:complete
MGSYRGGGFFTNMARGKGGGMNATPGLRQQQMGLVPSYTPMQTMGGKGGGKGAPTQNLLPGGGQIPNQGFMMTGQNSYMSPLSSLQPTYDSRSGQFTGLAELQPPPSYGGAPAYTTAVTAPKQAVPDFASQLTPRPETTPPQGVRVPRPVAGGGPRPQPKIVSNMFGTTKARTPAEQALLTQRQAEIDARVAQQNELATQQEEYDKMFGGLTEEQQAFFGDQLQRPEQIPQQDQAYASFLRNQLGPSNIFSQNFLSNILRNRVPPRNDFLGNQGLDQYGYDAQGNYLGRPPQPAFGYTKNGVQVNQIGYDQQGNYLGRPDDYYGPEQMVMRPRYDPRYDTTREDYKSPEELRLEAQKNRPQQMEELRKQMEQFQQRFNR